MVTIPGIWSIGKGTVNAPPSAPGEAGTQAMPEPESWKAVTPWFEVNTKGKVTCEVPEVSVSMRMTLPVRGTMVPSAVWTMVPEARLRLVMFRSVGPSGTVVGSGGVVVGPVGVMVEPVGVIVGPAGVRVGLLGVGCSGGGMGMVLPPSPLAASTLLDPIASKDTHATRATEAPTRSKLKVVHARSRLLWTRLPPFPLAVVGFLQVTGIPQPYRGRSNCALVSYGA